MELFTQLFTHCSPTIIHPLGSAYSDGLEKYLINRCVRSDDSARKWSFLSNKTLKIPVSGVRLPSPPPVKKARLPAKTVGGLLISSLMYTTLYTKMYTKSSNPPGLSHSGARLLVMAACPPTEKNNAPSLGIRGLCAGRGGSSGEGVWGLGAWHPTRGAPPPARAHERTTGAKESLFVRSSGGTHARTVAPIGVLVRAPPPAAPRPRTRPERPRPPLCGTGGSCSQA